VLDKTGGRLVGHHEFKAPTQPPNPSSSLASVLQSLYTCGCCK